MEKEKCFLFLCHSVPFLSSSLISKSQNLKQKPSPDGLKREPPVQAVWRSPTQCLALQPAAQMLPLRAALNAAWVCAGTRSRVTICAANEAHQDTPLGCRCVMLQCAVQIPGLLSKGSEIHLWGTFHISSCPLQVRFSFFCVTLSIWNADLAHLNLPLILRSKYWVLSEGEVGS